MRAERQTKVIVRQEDRCNTEQCNEQAYKAVYKLRVPVHKEHNYQCRKQQAAEYCRPELYNAVKVPEHKQIEQSIQRFNYSVSRGDLCSAGMAFSFKTAPADYRYKITLSDFSTAGHAVRVPFDKALVQRQPVDANVKKASDTGSENKYKHIND